MAAEALAAIALESDGGKAKDRNHAGLGAGAATIRTRRHGHLDSCATRGPGRALQSQQPGVLGCAEQCLPAGPASAVGISHAAGRPQHRPAVRRPDGRLDRSGHRAVWKLGRRGHAVPVAESAVSAAEHLHHAYLGTAGASELRTRELSEDCALCHRTALRRAASISARPATCVLNVTRNDPQNQNEFDGREICCRRARTAVFRPRPACTPASSPIPPIAAKSKNESTRSRAGFACAPTFVLALRSSSYTVFSIAKPATESARCSAVLEANDDG